MSKERFEYKKNEFIDYISDNKTGIVYIVTNYNDMTDMTKLLNKQNQRIADLEEQLANSIKPKFKIGQKVWYIDRYGVQKDIIVGFTYFSKENEILYEMHDEIVDHREKYIFATKEEALKKLEELGENK